MQNDFFLVINGNVKDVRLKLNSQISTTLAKEPCYQRAIQLLLNEDFVNKNRNLIMKQVTPLPSTICV